MTIRDRMLAVLEASDLPRLSRERAKRMRAGTLQRRERTRLGKKTRKRGRPKGVSENQITTASQVGKYATTTHEYKAKELKAPEPHPDFLKLLKILKKRGKCDPQKFD